MSSSVLRARVPTYMQVKVGVAVWTLSLSPEAVLALTMNAGAGDQSIPILDIDRAMESMRQKALDLRLFGGGFIALDEADLCAPLDPIVDHEGGPVVRRRWFTLVETAANDPA